MALFEDSMFDDEFLKKFIKGANDICKYCDKEIRFENEIEMYLSITGEWCWSNPTGRFNGHDPDSF